MTAAIAEAGNADSTKKYPAPRRRRQLDLLRLGRAALFHADHDLRFCALFRKLRGARSRERAGVVGICHRCRRPCDRADVAGAGGHRRCVSGRRKPWIAGFGVLLVVGASLMWIGRPGDRKHHCAAAARLCDRKRRRRIRHRFQQRDDADAGAARQDRAVVRHRLGHRLYRRHFQPDPRARLSRRQSRAPGARCSASCRCSGSIRSRIRATASPAR